MLGLGKLKMGLKFEDRKGRNSLLFWPNCEYWRFNLLTGEENLKGIFEGLGVFFPKKKRKKEELLVCLGSNKGKNMKTKVSDEVSAFIVQGQFDDIFKWLAISSIGVIWSKTMYRQLRAFSYFSSEIRNIEV
eukprot:TRINITY_DN15258_c0_g1_i1.p1 TRINITY_DN15258_c0_g1~~TRINITY_DN15258_c0_g1_i1.p1  ORF type:complete len:132 (-),score=22.64 TRINITY_DN15258_c0_g1_i1:299-694(-)